LDNIAHKDRTALDFQDRYLDQNFFFCPSAHACQQSNENACHLP
jgi:hypothetical protein